MEYSAMESTVAKIRDTASPAFVDNTYADLMKHEKDALGVAERVSDDMRTRDVRASSLWNTPLNAVFAEYAAFMGDVYRIYLAGDKQQFVDRVYTADGLIGGGITLLIVLLLTALLRV